MIPGFQGRNSEIVQNSQDSKGGTLEYSRIPTIPIPGFQGRNSGIIQNAYDSYSRIPKEEFCNIPEFLVFLFQDSGRGIMEYSRVPIIPIPGFQGEGFWNNSEFLLFQDSRGSNTHLATVTRMAPQ